MLAHLTRQGVTGRLELVLVDRGATAAAARALGRQHGVELRRVGWDEWQPVIRSIRHTWRVESARVIALAEALVSAGEAAVCVPANDEKAFAAAVDSLLRDPDRRATMGARSGETVWSGSCPGRSPVWSS